MAKFISYLESMEESNIGFVVTLIGGITIAEDHGEKEQRLLLPCAKENRNVRYQQRTHYLEIHVH